MNSIIRLLAYARPWRKKLILSIIALLIVSVLNIIAPLLVRNIIDSQTSGNINARIIITTSATLLLVYLFRAIMKYVSSQSSHYASMHMISKLQIAAYASLQKLSRTYYQNKQTGEIMSRVIHDAGQVEELVSHAVPDVITNSVMMVGVSLVMFLINPLLAAVTILTILPILVAARLNKKMGESFNEMNVQHANFSGMLHDNLSGVREIQIFGKQKQEEERISEQLDIIADVSLKALRWFHSITPGVEFFTAMGQVIVVGFGTWLAILGKISVGDIVGFLLYLSLFYGPVSALSETFQHIQQAFAGAERIFQLLDEKPDVMDGNVSISNVLGEISFRDVNYSYDGDIEVLKDISFDIKPGKIIAVVGPTGAGKTTLISLLMRFYDPTSGIVEIDGIDIRKMPLENLHTFISFIPQDTFLFNGTIGENIGYASINASLEQIIKAAKAAHINDFIEELPDKYNTLVGERGVRLSGGQKQRISIARALLRDTPILILDEATASVDTKTEHTIQQSIQQLSGNKTIIIIAHRLSTVKMADAIIVLERGRIVECGNHEELMKKNGLYSSFCMPQYIEEQQI